MEKVTYTGKGGFNTEFADMFLTEGVTYNVEYRQVGKHSTAVFLKEFPMRGFNEVHFKAPLSD